MFVCLQYGLAEDTLKGVQKVEGRDHPSDGLYSQSAVYIAAAHALKSDYPVSDTQKTNLWQ